MRHALLVGPLLLAACTSDDPGDGGFFNGVAGIAGGGYDARIAEREAAVEDARAEGAALNAELAALDRELGRLKTEIIQRRAALSGQGVRLSSASEAQVQQVLAANPAQSDPAARAAALRRAIAEARALSGELASLSG